MTPIKFTVKNNVTHFHYRASELIKFVRIGKKYENTGIILVRKEKDIFIYRGFGTIENPCKNIIEIKIKHNKIFDEDIPKDEEILKPKKIKQKTESISFTFLDFSI